MEIKFYDQSEFESQLLRTQQLYDKLSSVLERKQEQVNRALSIKAKLNQQLQTINSLIPTTKSSNFQNFNFKSGFHSAIGRRSSNEDSHIVSDQILAIFDGHGGAETAEFASQQIMHYLTINQTGNVPTNLKLSILNLDQNLPQSCNDSGATLALVVKKNNKFYLCNAGDSRVLTQFHDTKDHKPSDKSEKERIEKYGGLVMNGRVNAQLAVSRAIGDRSMKIYGVCGLVDIIEVDQSEIDWIMIACDGVFDVINNDDIREAIRCYLYKIENSDMSIVQLILDFYHDKEPVSDVMKMQCNYNENHKNEAKLAQAIVCAAYSLKSSDNISVIIAVKNDFNL